MAGPGSSADPLRVAVIGSGPAGFYTVGHLVKSRGLTVSVDMFERLPTPFGLVRAGVAPDHQKDKSVTRAFDRSAAAAAFRYFGNVEYGTHLTLADLCAHYHQIVFATGAQADRELEIPGEDAKGCHSATEFVAWYNGHPDYVDLQFDLDVESAAIVGVGNVAIDVARMLLQKPEELARTDMADYALAALEQSRIRTVHLLGRRGPAQAAFTAPELEELTKLDVAVRLRQAEAELDAASRVALEAAPEPRVEKNLRLIEALAAARPASSPRTLWLRFLVSPVAVLMDAQRRVTGLSLVRNRAYLDDDGQVRVRPTPQNETLDVGLVFKSVGYRGVALPDVPFDDERGVVPNSAGRVLDVAGAPVPGLYVVGWIKRGSTGVIGTNKIDARETVRSMLEDSRAGRLLAPRRTEPAAIDALIAARQPSAVTYTNWRRLNDEEIRRGLESDRPRVKFTDVAEMLDLLDL